MERADVDHSLRWGAECRLEARAAVPQGDLVCRRGRRINAKQPPLWALSEKCKQLARALTANITFLHSSAFVSVSLWINWSAPEAVFSVCINVRSLSQCFMPCCSHWKARLDRSREKSLLFVPAHWPVQLSLQLRLFNLEEMGRPAPFRVERDWL